MAIPQAGVIDQGDDVTEAEQEYIEPAIADLGDLTELTAGQTDGEVLDRSFPAGTPKRDLTFS